MSPLMYPFLMPALCYYYHRLHLYALYTHQPRFIIIALCKSIYPLNLIVKKDLQRKKCNRTQICLSDAQQSLRHEVCGKEGVYFRCCQRSQWEGKPQICLPDGGENKFFFL